jgi:hypothetical protein
MMYNRLLATAALAAVAVFDTNLLTLKGFARSAIGYSKRFRLGFGGRTNSDPVRRA